MEVPALDGTPDAPPTLDNRGASLRTSEEVLGGPHDFLCKGLSPHALTLSRATPRGWLSCRCSAAHASLNRGLSSHLQKRSGEAQDWWGWGRGNWKENNSPHSSILALLTSPAHPAEALPLAAARGPERLRCWEGRGCPSQIPGRCPPQSHRSCFSGDRQHHLRCHCLPHWMSSRTWGQFGRRLLNLPCGLVPESCQVGLAIPISQRRKLRGRAGIQTPVTVPVDAVMRKGEMLTLRW